MSERQFKVVTEPKLDVSDGYHTFGELYDHRIELWIALCRNYPGTAWRTRKHSDGSSFDGWFVLGLFHGVGKQITYHLPDARWADCSFAETLSAAPLFDGHTSTDVIERIRNL